MKTPTSTTIKTVPSAPFPDMESVAEETSAREVNGMLRAGWKLLVVVAAHDGGGGYPVYVVGRPRAGIAQISTAPVDALC